MEIKSRKSLNTYQEEEITWESVGDDLFYRKNKFEFTLEEKNLIKKLLLKSPPPLQYRRKVRIYYLKIYNLVMVNKFWCCKGNV
jgi:hypothetical protein